MWVHEGGHASEKIKGIGGRGGGRLLFVVRRDGGHCCLTTGGRGTGQQGCKKLVASKLTV